MGSLDHLTEGRARLGIGPDELVPDALMLGIGPILQRPRVNESLDVIVRLLTDPTRLTYRSQWIELHDGTLQLRPFVGSHLPTVVASLWTPSGLFLAG